VNSSTPPALIEKHIKERMFHRSYLAPGRYEGWLQLVGGARQWPAKETSLAADRDQLEGGEPRWHDATLVVAVLDQSSQSLSRLLKKTHMLRCRSIASLESVFVVTCSCSFGILDHVFTDTSTSQRLASGSF
jgi:hypothetical protein